MTGWSPQGASLWVAAAQVERVRELLACVVAPLDEPEDEDSEPEPAPEPGGR